MIAPVRIASLALVHLNKVLLIRRAFAPYRQHWSLPGGHLEAGETTAQCAVREVHEELGITVSDPVFVINVPLHGNASPDSLDVFAAREFSGAVTPSNEVAEWNWFDLAAAGNLMATPGLCGVLGMIPELSRGFELK